MSKIINGNKVFLDDVRGRWTVLFVRDRLRKQYNSEQEANAAAAGGGGSLGDRTTAVVPKQAVQTAVKDVPPAINDFVNKAEISVTQRVSTEGNVINAKIGTEEDGFRSMSVTTTEGASNEGPSVSIMTANIKKGSATIVKTIGDKSKLASVTGKTAKSNIVLNETIVQANPKGGIQALKTVAKVEDKELSQAFDKLSPVPSLVQESVKVQAVDGGITATITQVMKKAEKEVTILLKNPFGSNNTRASAGSSFGNILGQIVSIAQNAPQRYTSPLTAVKVAATETVLNEKNEKIPTPNITNENGSTNIKDVVTKSSTENINPEAVSTIPPYEVGTGLENYDINTRTEFNGGTFRFPMIGHESHFTAEFKACEREITHLIISFTKWKTKRYYFPEQVQVGWRKTMVKRFGEAAISANPVEYAFPSHFYINQIGGVHVTRDLNLTTNIKGNIANPYTGAIFVLVDAGEDGDANAVNVGQMGNLGRLIDEFLKVYPGAEILGLSDVREDVTNNPPIDIRSFVKSRNRKASTLKERKVESIPNAADLAERQPVNIPLPKKPSSNKLPNTARVANEINKKVKIPSVNSANYKLSQEEALNAIKEKNDLIVAADKKFGSGQLGNLLGKVGGLDNVAKNLLDAGQEFKNNELKLGKVFDSVKGIFK